MNPAGMSAGRVVVETLGYDGGREVTVYVPSRQPEAIIYAGDGELVAPWGGLLEGHGLPATVVVGTHRLADETLRIREYSPGASTAQFSFDPERFAAHESFFTRDVPAWVRSRFDVALPRDRTAVFGVSAGAELALAMGLLHPDLYAAVLCASPGAGYRPPPALTGPLPRFYFVAGRQEPFFLANAVRWANALTDAGAQVLLTQREGSHGGPFWKKELPRMAAWAFGQ